MKSLATEHVQVSRPKITILMLICGIVGAASIGAVSAATTDDEVPSVAIRFNPQNLDTDSGARALYRRIVSAAAEVCPSTTPHWVTRDVSECREQAVARAVHQINNPRLVAVHSVSSRKG